MIFSDLLQPAFLIPAARCTGLGLVIFLGVWWNERRGGGFALPALGLAWALVHLMVNANSYLLPPKESADWLVFGALGLVPAALAARILKLEKGAALPAALLLAAAAWLALHKLSWLLDRTESPAQRVLWTAGIVAAVVAAFASAEFAARKVPPGAVAGGLAFFAITAALALRHMNMPERSIARLMAAAGLLAGIGLACMVPYFLRRPLAGMPRGMAGWLAGSVVLLFILGCLSRASGVPLLPMSLAAAALPVAALAVFAGHRLTGGVGLVFVTALAVTGGALVMACSGKLEAPAATAPSAAPTGADDTGAYEGY